MNVKLFVFALVFSALAANPLQAAKFDDAQRVEIQRLGLVEIDSRYFDEVYGQNLDQLDEMQRIYIADLEMDDVEFNEPRNARFGRRSAWYLTDADREWINDQYRESLTEAIEAAGGYQIVDQPSSDALTISAQLVELSPLAPRDDFRSRDAFTEYYSEGTGDLTISIDVTHDDVRLLSLIDERSAGYQWERNDSFSSKRNVSRVIDRWAHNLIAQLKS